jgi:hypothetical protein
LYGWRFWTPDAQARAAHRKRTAISVKGEDRAVRLLARIQGDQVSDRSFFSVVSPNESPAGRADYFRVSLPVPRRRPDGLF